MKNQFTENLLLGRFDFRSPPNEFQLALLGVLLVRATLIAGAARTSRAHEFRGAQLAWRRVSLFTITAACAMPDGHPST